MSFQPTYLYIKRHSVTGKCYFGKTTKKDVLKYNGSGSYWAKHVKLHGIKYIETLWYKLFTDQDECTRVALTFSRQQDIVNSDLWLNLVPEDGLAGTPSGIKRTPEQNAEKSARQTGKTYKKRTPEQKAEQSTRRTGMKYKPRIDRGVKRKKITPEQSLAQSIRQTGKKRKSSKKLETVNR